MTQEHDPAPGLPGERLRILCDFDGTVSPVDTTDALLDALADPEWREVERDWSAGLIDARTCMTRQARLLRGGWGDVQAVLDGLRVDPDFVRFASLCAARGDHLLVVSDGYEQAITRLLAPLGVPFEVRANRLVRWSDGHWSLEAPFGSPLCRSAQSHCKCLSLPPARWKTVVIGDGRSDLCVARRADLVLARDGEDGPSALLQACRDEKLPHRPFRGFADVIEAVAGRNAARAVPCASM
jgi:2-hydroxy-3-keto-5-methylthiopentenyl-1-phosphate phosphatase